MICSQIYAALLTISICIARADPGHGGGIGGGAGGGHGGGGFVGFAGGHTGFGGRGGSGGIYLGRPYYGQNAKREVNARGFGSEGVVLPWPIYRDYYDYY